MIYSEMKLLNFERLFICKEVSKMMRKKIMESTYYYEYDTYNIGADFEEQTVRTIEFYTKNKELVASIKSIDGESSLESFNKNVKVGFEESKEIRKHLEELEIKRKDGLERSYKYLDSVDIKKEYIDEIKKDAFYAYISQDGEVRKSIEIRNDDFEILCQYRMSFIEYEKMSWDKTFRIKGKAIRSLEKGDPEYYSFFIPDWYLSSLVFVKNER